MRFCWHVHNSPRNKNLKSPNPYLLYKMVFLASKTLLYHLSIGKKLFFPALNLMILQRVWNECVRFGGHMNIQVSYKILQLEVSKKAPILHNGWFEAILETMRFMMSMFSTCLVHVIVIIITIKRYSQSFL
jgi:hypothetical protein